MIQGHPVVDADSHKCENPPVFFEHVPREFRNRIGFVRDRYGEQRIRIVDRDPRTGRPDLERIFLQPEGFGKGTFRPYHDETSIGGLFNRVRLEHMDREGVDHQVIYGSVSLAFGSIIDDELAIALCRAYNDYIVADTAMCPERLHPVAVLPLQNPIEAIAEMHRCVEGLGMPAVMVAPNLPRPHPAAPDAFPDVRVPKPLSHPDFFGLFEEAERLGVAIGIHGAPGFQLAGGASDQVDSFTLVHVFANRAMQQMALSKLMFDGVLERFPKLRFGFLEAGCGWVPDFVQNLHEHWEKRIEHFDPELEVSVPRYLVEMARERRADGRLDLARKARGLMQMLFTPADEEASPEELEAFRYEHPLATRDPWEYVERGQVFFTSEPDDPAPAWLPHAMGEVGTRISGMAVDYGHWDATLADCVALATQNMDADQAVRNVSTNALEFYGDRLRKRMGVSAGAQAW
jgi:predicted TIM-barrel fold metal-dependent hydrolase